MTSYEIRIFLRALADNQKIKKLLNSGGKNGHTFSKGNFVEARAVLFMCEVSGESK